MLNRGGGSIIHVASCAGILGFQNLTAYSASKGGVLGLMLAMAADYASDNISGKSFGAWDYEYRNERRGTFRSAKASALDCRHTFGKGR
jgi:NADP-dependent 3-hydroxy acid dehydrogenase YdfG